MKTQISADTLSVNKPSLRLFKKPRGLLLLALTSYACLHVQHSSFLCMSSLELFSRSLFLSTYLCIYVFFYVHFFYFAFFFLLWFDFISFAALWPSSSFFLITALARSNRAMHPPYSFSQRGSSLTVGSLTRPRSVLREKIKAIPFIVRFPLFLPGESRAHRMDSEHGALLLSRITTGNVFPCDVTVNNFSAKGNKSVDFGRVLVFLSL